MDSKRLAWGLLIGFLCVAMYLFFKVSLDKKEIRQDGALYTIGILQTASHPALDAAQQGFLDEVKACVGDKVAFVVQNGQGSVSTIHTIAQQFHAKREIQGVFAIATPAAQAIISVEPEKPIYVAAVSLAPSTEEFLKKKNVCGVSDMIDVRAEVEAMKLLLPDAHTVGILFSTAEINSVAMVAVMEKELKALGLVPQLVGVTSEADIEPALMSALRKVDAILAPTDNMVANAISLISDLVSRSGKPLIVSDNMLVQYGALMSRGVDYYESGRQAGKMAIRVFVDGKKPRDLSIVKVQTKEIFVNKLVADRLGIIVPDSIKRDVVFV